MDYMYKTVREVGPENFKGHFVLPYGLESIDMAFSDCTQLISVTIPNTIKYLGSYTFFNCVRLREVEIISYVPTVGVSCFQNCYSLKSVILPPGVRIIEDKAFFVCSALNDINIPDEIEFIGVSAFEGCESLKNIKLSSCLREIDSCAFRECSLLTEIIMPDRLNKLGKEVFKGCDNLEKIRFSPNVSDISEAICSGCVKLEKIILPEGITKISNYAFEDCLSLIEISLPESLRSLGSNVFRNCQIPDIVIPEYLEIIDNKAFHNMAMTPRLHLTMKKCRNTPILLARINNPAFLECHRIITFCNQEDEHFSVEIGPGIAVISEHILPPLTELMQGPINIRGSLIWKEFNY